MSRLKNKLDSLFFNQLFVSERKQIAFMADEKTHVRISHRLFAINRSEMGSSMRVKQFIKSILIYFDKVVFGQIDGKIPILAYHSITDQDSDISVSIDRFSLQMKYLYEQGFKTITNEQLLQLREGEKVLRQRKVVMITFDDGYKDFLDIAVPIMEKYKFSATVFISPELVGKKIQWNKNGPIFSLMNWSDINEVIQRGFEVGNHTLTHVWLKRIDSDNLKREIDGARVILEKRAGKIIKSFCSPYGVLGRKAKLFLYKNKKQIIYSGKEGLCNYKSKNLFYPRITIDNKMSFNDFCNVLQYRSIYFYSIRNVLGILKKDIPFLIGIRVLKKARVIR
ncbi:MAG: polysaccharide deacetylase family protein [Lachnospiraceae bacterium]|nr:polysaccharide deacetylase family protein [Lachnospiraceae bacterium]